uniref:Uncharacterized protein n=1 Tax=Periophthalmus magnuspinnatus TaxID=409849 RepID=A0A3B3ZVY1_9GOBI
MNRVDDLNLISAHKLTNITRIHIVLVRLLKHTLYVSAVPGRTGRYTLIEKWRDIERHLSPQEYPVVSLNKWGQYSSDVQLILQRTGPSVTERPMSDGTTR